MSSINPPSEQPAARPATPPAPSASTPAPRPTVPNPPAEQPATPRSTVPDPPAEQPGAGQLGAGYSDSNVLRAWHGVASSLVVALPAGLKRAERARRRIARRRR